MDRVPVWTESRKVFRDATDRADILAWLCEEDGYCIYLSEGWHRATGTTDGEGWNWINELHPDDRKRAFDAFSKANDTRSSYIVEYRLRLADGQYTPATARGMPTFSCVGVFQGMVGFTELDLQKRRFRPRSPSSQLTQREREILGLFAMGHTAETAGVALGITTPTVAHHAKSAVGKLNALNRTHAVVLAMSLNEISSPGIF